MSETDQAFDAGRFRTARRQETAAIMCSTLSALFVTASFLLVLRNPSSITDAYSIAQFIELFFATSKMAIINLASIPSALAALVLLIASNHTQRALEIEPDPALGKMIGVFCLPALALLFGRAVTLL
jgi:hypothetical protein